MPRALPRDTASAVGTPPVVRNRSLFADKYAEFPRDEDDKTARARTVEHLCGPEFEDGSSICSNRLPAAAMANARVFNMKLASRLIVNHAGGVIENAGLALDRNSGSPFIPGSTVKGIARLGAGLCEANPADLALVFGWAASRRQEADLPASLPVKSFGGTVAFLPAYPVGRAALERDIVTVHHPAYYFGEKARASDNEMPIPNAFPTVKAGAEFRFVLMPVGSARASAVRDRMIGGYGSDLLAKAEEWLRAGLTDHGVGAKTAAGYGCFRSCDRRSDAGEKQESSDFTDVTFKNAIERRLDRRGEWNVLKPELLKLKKPANAVWKARFMSLTKGERSYRELRAIVEGE